MPVFAPYRGCASHRFTGGLDLRKTAQSRGVNVQRLLEVENPVFAGEDGLIAGIGSSALIDRGGHRVVRCPPL